MKRKNLCKRIGAILLAAAMCFTGLPIDALAASGNDAQIIYEKGDSLEVNEKGDFSEEEKNDLSDEESIQENSKEDSKEDSKEVSKEDSSNESQENSEENYENDSEDASEVVSDDSDEDASEEISEEAFDDMNEDVDSEDEADFYGDFVEGDEGGDITKAQEATEKVTSMITLSTTEDIDGGAGGWYWDYTKKILYLNKADIEVAGNYAISAPCDFTIHVTGECVIDALVEAVYCPGVSNITVTGPQPDLDAGSVTYNGSLKIAKNKNEDVGFILNNTCDVLVKYVKIDLAGRMEVKALSLENYGMIKCSCTLDTKAAVIADTVTLNGGTKLDITSVKTSLLAHSGMEVFNAGTVLADATESDAIVVDGEGDVTVYSSGSLHLSATKGNGIVISDGDLHAYNGGIVYLDYIEDEFYGVSINKGDVILEYSGAIVAGTIPIVDEDSYIWGSAIKIAEGDLNLNTGGRLSLATRKEAIVLESGNFNAYSFTASDIETYNGWSVIKLSGGKISISTGTIHFYGGSTPIVGCSELDVNSGANVYIDCKNGGDIVNTYSINRILVSGSGAKLTLNEKENSSTSYVNMTVTDNAEAVIYGQVYLTSGYSLDVDNNAKVLINSTKGTQQLYVYDSGINVSNGGKLQLNDLAEDGDHAGQACYASKSQINVVGPNSVFEINNLAYNNALYLSDSSINIKEGIVSLNSRKCALYPYYSSEKPCINISNNGLLDIDVSTDNGKAIWGGMVDININDADFSVTRDTYQTTDLIDSRVSFTVKNADIVEPENAKVVDGKIVNEDGSTITGAQVTIEARKVPSLYISKQPAKQIVGTIADPLSINVEVSTCNMTEAQEATIKYQWYVEREDGEDEKITSATSSVFSVPKEYGLNVYYCEVTALDGERLISDKCQATVLPGEERGRKVITHSIVIDDSTETQSHDEEGWSWNKENKELILDNVCFNTTDSTNSPLTISVSPANIKLIGDCYFYNTVSQNAIALGSYNGKTSEEDVFNINGTGSLNIICANNGAYGIYAQRHVIFNAPVDIYAYSQTINTSGSVKLVFNKPAHLVSTKSRAFYGYLSYLEIYDDFYAKGYNNGIYAYNIEAKDCNITVSSDNGDNAFETYGGNILLDNVKLTVDNRNTTGCGIYVNGNSSNSFISKNNTEINILLPHDYKVSQAMYISAPEFKLIDSKLSVDGSSSYTLYCYSNYGSDYLVENSEIDINNVANEGYGLYFNGYIKFVNSFIDISSYQYALYANKGAELDNTVYKSVLDSANTSSTGVWVNSEFVLKNGSEFSVTSAIKSTVLFNCTGVVQVIESALNLLCDSTSTSGVLFAAQGVELIGSVIKSPVGAKFDGGSHIYKLSGNEYVTDLKVDVDTNSYIIPDGIEVTQDGKKVEDGIVSQGKNAKLTALYTPKNGTPSDLEFAWYRFDYKENKYVRIDGANTSEYSLSDCDGGYNTFKCIYSYGTTEIEREISIHIVYPNRQITYPDEGESYLELTKMAPIDKMATHGWSWDNENCVLTLSNAYFLTEIDIPADSKIILEDGMDSYIRTGFSGIKMISSGGENLSISGKARITIQSGFSEQAESVASCFRAFKKITFGPGVKADLVNWKSNGNIFAVSSTTSETKVVINHSELNMHIYGSSGNLMCGSLVLNGCEVSSPDKYYVKNNALYSNEACNQKLKSMVITPTKERFEYFTKLPDTAVFMNTDEVKELETKFEVFNYPADTTISYEWYEASDWEKKDPVLVQTGNKYTPSNEIGEHFIFVKAIVNDGNATTSFESDVIGAYVLPAGRKPVLMNVYLGTSSSYNNMAKYGYSWDKDTNELTLDNAFIYNKTNNVALNIPANAKVIVTDGSVNVIRSEYAGLIGCSASKSGSSITFSGKGKLTMENVNEDYKNTLFGTYSFDKTIFTDEIDATVCGSRTKVYTGIQLGHSLIVDNATLNVLSGHSENSISVYNGTYGDNCIELKNKGVLNVANRGKVCHIGATYNIAIDDTSEFNAVSELEEDPEYSDREYGIYIGGAVNNRGTMNIEVPKGTAIYASELTVASGATLNCTGTGTDSQDALVFVDRNLTVNGTLKAETASAVPALYQGMSSGTVNITAGALVTLINNNSVDDVSLSKSTLTLQSTKTSISGYLYVKNNGGGNAMCVYNTNACTFGEGVTFDPAGAKIAKLSGTAKPALTDKDGNKLSEFHIYGSEPLTLESVTISGEPKAGKTLSVSGLVPADATAIYQWEYSDEKDTGFTNYYGGIGKSSITLDDNVEGMYFRVKATGTGFYANNAYSNVIGPVVGTFTRIDSVKVNDSYCSYDYINKYTIKVPYATTEASIAVAPHTTGATVTIGSEIGLTATIKDLEVGANNVTITVEAEGETKEYTLVITRNEPAKYDITVAAGVLPEGIELSAVSKDEDKASVKTADSVDSMKVKEKTEFTVSVTGSNAQYGAWAIRKGMYLVTLDNKGNYVDVANEAKAYGLDADCYYVNAPVSPKAEWMPNENASVKVSWTLPGGSMPAALSEAYAYDYVIVDCLDPVTGEVIDTKKADSTNTYAVFNNLDYLQGYDFVIRYGNDKGLKVVPAGCGEEIEALTKTKASVGERPSGYEVILKDSEGRQVNFAALKLDDENESVKVFTTNLPEGIVISDELLTSSDAEVAEAEVNEFGEIVVAAKKVGSTFITFKPVIYGCSSTVQLRIDVYNSDEAEKITAPKLTKNKLTANIYSSVATEDSTLRIYFDGDSTDKITSAAFTDETLNKYFELQVKDDRTLAMVPTSEFDFGAKENAAEVKKIKASYKAGIVVKTVKYPEGNTTAQLTVKITKKLPTVKAAAVKLNTFFEDASAEIAFSSKQGEVTGAVINSDKKNPCPEWLNYSEDTMSVSVAGTGLKKSGNLLLLADVEGYNTPAAVTVKVSASKTAPKLKLASNKLTVAKYKSDILSPISLKLVSADKKQKLADMNITDIAAGYSVDLSDIPENKRAAYMAGMDFEVDKFIAETGDISLKLSSKDGEIISAGKLLVAVFFDNNPNQKVEFTVDIKVSDKVTIKTAKSITLDLTMGIGVDMAYTDIIPSTAGYDMGSNIGSDSDTFKIEILDAKGKTDASEELDYTYSQTYGVLTFTSNEKTKPGSYKVNVTARNGAKTSLTVKTSAALPKYKLSASTITLNKKNSEDCEYVTISGDKYAKAELVVRLKDSKGNIVSDNSPVNFEMVDMLGTPGTTFKVCLTDNAVYGASYKLEFVHKLEDYPDVSSKPVTLTIKVPAEAKSVVKATVKTSGSIDPARPDSAVTFTEKRTNITTNSISTVTLEVYAKNGKKPATGDYITEGKADGLFILTAKGICLNEDSECYLNDAFDASLNYTGKIVYKLKNGETFTSNEFKIPVKQGKIKVTQNTDKVSLCKADRFDRSYVYFKIEDTSVSDLRKVDIYTKKGAVSNFEIKEIGNGIYALGFSGTEVAAKVKSEKIKLNLYFDGCKNPSTGATVNIKIDILDIK